MADEKISFWRSIVIVFALVSVLWLVQFIQQFGHIDLTSFANHPRNLDGLKGIIFSPFIHAPNDIQHLLSNTLPLMVLLAVLINAYPKVALFVLVFIHLVSGTLVWLFAPEDTLHIGISGIIYGIASFLVASGIFRKDRSSVTIAILTALVYGGMIAGFFKKEGISWQSHLYGAISGVIIAFFFRNHNLPEPVDFHNESTEPEKHFFDNSGSA
ncbi:MAG TPA: rhomboid family intramembrane serine protease [Chitinophagales bacterium]|nr:rhomboid family intramembrane serine protease [Chitinophagales bacterium]